MRCRTITDDGTIVWFGSKGKDTSGNTIFENDTHASYSDEQKGLASSLTERLSVLKHELWYDYEYGLPLVDKIKSKAQMDSFILQQVYTHPDVYEVLMFESDLKNSQYSCKMTISSVFGKITLKI